MRINKYIANAGICSRRKADEYIMYGKVKVNGEVISSLGIDIDENKDIVEVEDVVVKLEEEKIYLMLNKPIGYVTTMDEQYDRPSVIDLINENVRVYPIGRLDMYTEGLLLLTNDGEFANKMMHPKNKIRKTYIARVTGKITEEKINNLKDGVEIDEYLTAPAEVYKVSENELKIIIAEGKNRQIRKMCETQDLKVVLLRRVKVGNLELGNLKLGKYRRLSLDEIEKI